MPAQPKLIDDPEALRPYLADWDRLAVAAGRPYCAPVWALTWWRRAAPPGAQLRVALALEGDSLLGVAPFYSGHGGRSAVHALLAAPTSAGVEPLAREGHEADCARAFAAALDGSGPPVGRIDLEGVPAGSPWPELLARAWPRRLTRVSRYSDPAPTLRLGHDDLDGYLATRSRNLRNNVKRQHRRLQEEGVVFRASSAERLAGDLGAFARMHYARWQERGGSSALDPRVEAFLREAGAEMLAEGRFRLFVAEADGGVISAHLFVAAGGHVSYWLGGFDEAWSRFTPGTLGVIQGIDDALHRGEERLDLGPGAQPYKLRLADGQEELQWLSLVSGVARPSLARLTAGAGRARGALVSRLPERARRVLRRLRRR